MPRRSQGWDMPHWKSHLILTGTVSASAVPLPPPLPLALLKPACICVISDAIWSLPCFSSLCLELLASESKGSKAFTFACDHYWQTFKNMKKSAHLLYPYVCLTQTASCCAKPVRCSHYDQGVVCTYVLGAMVLSAKRSSHWMAAGCVNCNLQTSPQGVLFGMVTHSHSAC